MLTLGLEQGASGHVDAGLGGLHRGPCYAGAAWPSWRTEQGSTGQETVVGRGRAGLRAGARNLDAFLQVAWVGPESEQSTAVPLRPRGPSWPHLAFLYRERAEGLGLWGSQDVCPEKQRPGASEP